MNTFRRNNVGVDVTAKSETMRKMIYILAFFFIFATAIYAIPDTFGRFAQEVIGSDSAFAAKFSIEIIIPEELDSISHENRYQHYFPKEGETKLFSFRIRNTGEVLTSCRPYITHGVQYLVLVDNELQSEFPLDVGETVDFQLIILSDGLSTEITEASLFIDIQQLERK